MEAGTLRTDNLPHFFRGGSGKDRRRHPFARGDDWSGRVGRAAADGEWADEQSGERWHGGSMEFPQQHNPAASEATVRRRDGGI